MVLLQKIKGRPVWAPTMQCMNPTRSFCALLPLHVFYAPDRTMRACGVNPNCVSTASTNQLYAPAWRTRSTDARTGAQAGHVAHACHHVAHAMMAHGALSGNCSCIRRHAHAAGSTHLVAGGGAKSSSTALTGDAAVEAVEAVDAPPCALLSACRHLSLCSSTQSLASAIDELYPDATLVRSESFDYGEYRAYTVPGLFGRDVME